MTYTGKMFEEDFKKAQEAGNSGLLHRLYDTTNGFRGNANIADFILLSPKKSIYIECKVTAKASLPFANISDRQWDGLLNASSYLGVEAGVLVLYGKHNRIVWHDIRQLAEHARQGFKSINPTRDTFGQIEVNFKTPRTRPRLDVDELVRAIEEGEQWSD